MQQKTGFNWARDLHNIQEAINNVPKEVVAHQTPADVFVYRMSVSVQRKASRATLRCSKRMVLRHTRRKHNAVYQVGENILVRFPKTSHKNLVPRRRFVLEGTVLKRKVLHGLYFVRFTTPSGKVTSEWFRLDDVTSTTAEKDVKKRAKSKNTYQKLQQRQNHREKYLLTKTHHDNVEELLNENETIRILLDPHEDVGSCQFAAFADQLLRISVHRTALQLRIEAVQHIESFPDNYNSFIEGSIVEFIKSMKKPSTYGDHITLLALAAKYNVQVLVVSNQGPEHTVLVSESGIYDEVMPLLTLGYFPEGQGEHYISIAVHFDTMSILLYPYTSEGDRDQETPWSDKETVEGDQETVEGDQEAMEGDQETVVSDQETVEGDQEPVVSDLEMVEGDQETVEGDEAEECMDYEEREFLPRELQRQIILICVQEDPSFRFTLRCVNLFFMTVIQEVPPPNLHIDPSSGAYSQYDQGSPVINPRASLPRYIDPSEVASIPEPRPSPKFDQSDPNSWADIEYIDVLDDEDVYGITRKRYHSTYFLEEPLYQHYTKDRNSRDKEYMEIDPFEMDKSPTESLQGSDLTATLTRLAPGMGMRTMWSKMPQVAESNILDKITPKERKVQEAIFEIITSEASYLKSMNVVIDHFVKAPEFYDEAMPECILEKHDQHALFSNIGAVRDASERFLEDLEAQWMQNVKIDDIGHILRKHSEKNFNVYIVYCSNQAFQTKKLQELMQRPSFKDAVLRLQQSPACSGLPLDSFLLLPMQRITRLPLLIDTICHRLEPDTERHRSSFIALQKLNGLVKKCNEGVRKMQQTEQMVILKKQIEFKIRQVPLVSANRFLVKQGDLIKIGNESNNWLPGLKAKPTKVPIYLILFNDLLLVSKKKNNGQFVVTDHCQRNSLELVPLDGDIKQYCPLGVPTGCSNLFLMVMLENHEEKQVDMILSCSSSAERVRWIDACTPVKEEQEGEKIYEDWDCPQVQAIKTYIAQEPDEMTLNESDVINVTRKIDKWYEGERLRDSERGWFPADCCKEIINTHVRARNLRQAYRMKSFSIDESNFKGK